MPMNTDPKQIKLGGKQVGKNKHHCPICKKEFTCQRALKRHMRAHRINYEHISDGEEWPPAAVTDVCTRKPKYPHICENYGKEFLTLKPSFENVFRNPDAAVAGGGGGGGDVDARAGFSPSSSTQSWYEGKPTSHDKGASSSTHPPHSNTEEEDAAHCLLMLSSACVERVLITNEEEISTSSSKVVNDRIIYSPLIPMLPPGPNPNPPVPSKIFPCKSCKKVFPSHQALGGHRASHKKVKGCFAAPDPTTAQIEDQNNTTNCHQNNMIQSSSENKPLLIARPLVEKSPQPLPKKNPKVHICTICDQQFPSGQALGGHKRFHRNKTEKFIAATAIATATASAINSTITATTYLEVETSNCEMNVMQSHTLNLLQNFNESAPTIDLNIPAPIDKIVGSPLRLGISATNYAQSGWEMNHKRKKRKATTMSDNDNEKERASNEKLENDAESKEVKMATLTDLWDDDEKDGSSTWLQIGLGSISGEKSNVDRS